MTTICVMLFVCLQMCSIECVSPCKIRPIRKIEYQTQSVEPLKPVLWTMGEVDCALECLKVDISHLFQFKYERFHLSNVEV